MLNRVALLQASVILIALWLGFSFWQSQDLELSRRCNQDSDACTSKFIDRIRTEYQSKQRGIGGGCNGDIAEHLPILRKFAIDPNVSHVSEVGVRDGYATFAFLDAAVERWQRRHLAGASGPLTVRLYDITKTASIKALLGDLECECPALDVKFAEGDDLKISIEDTDFMLLDTWHTYRQLAAELKVIPQRVRQRISFHDTVLFAYGDEGDDVGHGGKPIEAGLYVGLEKKSGLMPAIEEFLVSEKARSPTGAFMLEEAKQNCNGLVILKRA